MDVYVCVILSTEAIHRNSLRTILAKFCVVNTLSISKLLSSCPERTWPFRFQGVSKALLQHCRWFCYLECELWLGWGWGLQGVREEGQRTLEGMWTRAGERTVQMRTVIWSAWGGGTWKRGQDKNAASSSLPNSTYFFSFSCAHPERETNEDEGHFSFLQPNELFFPSSPVLPLLGFLSML
jgi:hypothetical protein